MGKSTAPSRKTLESTISSYDTMATVTSAEVSHDDTTQPQGRPCAACGSPVEPGDRFCNACGSPAEEAPPARDQTAASDALPQKHLRCETCGAEVNVDASQRSYTCAFCDSTYVVEFAPETTGRQSPEFVIGFSVTPQQAQDKFAHWLRSNRWFRPGDLNQARIVERLRGVYLPFWSFSMLAQSGWSALIGEYWYRTETYTTTENGKTVTKTRQVRETEWWPLDGRHHRYYSGFLVSGSRGLPQEMAERIKPFRLAALKRYAPYFLAGWLSEEYSLQRETALELCQQEFGRREQQNVAAFLPGDDHRGLTVDTRFEHVNSDLILLPVYLLSYRYQDKVYRFLVNGQTGRTAGDKPLSKARIGAAIGVALLVIAIIVLLFRFL